MYLYPRSFGHKLHHQKVVIVVTMARESSKFAEEDPEGEVEEVSEPSLMARDSLLFLSYALRSSLSIFIL